jgi:DNA-binding NarL/FixJ family response regulator
MRTVLIADGLPIVRCGLHAYVKELNEPYQLFEAACYAEIKSLLMQQQISHLVTDLFFPDGNILSGIDEIKSLQPGIHILIHTAASEKIYGKRLLSKGAKGLIRKQSSSREIRNAFRCLFGNEIYISNDLKSFLFDPMRSAHPLHQLSDRELEFIECLAGNMPLMDIAQHMNLAPSTVNMYKRRAFKKLNIQTLPELRMKLLAV